MNRTFVRGAAIAAAVPLTLAMAACSSSSSGGNSASPSTTSSASSSSSSTTVTQPTATASPTSTAQGVGGLTLGVTSTSAKSGQPVGVSVSGANIDGKQVLILNKNSGSDQIIAKLTVGAGGKADGYIVLNETTSIQAGLPSSTVSGDTVPSGTTIDITSPVVKITVG